MGKTLVKAFRNLTTGEDHELAKACEKFRKLVEHEKDVVQNLTLKGLLQVRRESSTLQADILNGRAATRRIEQSTKELAGRADQAQELLKGGCHVIRGNLKTKPSKKTERPRSSVAICCNGCRR